MQRLPSRDLVLVGAGHASLHVIRMWAQSPVPDVRLTVVSPDVQATYSGMLPGTLAGHYRREEMLIDLDALCHAAGARLIVDRCVGLNAAQRTIALAGRPAIPFDVAAVGVGSLPAGTHLVSSHPGLVSIKPMISFQQRLQAALGTVSGSEIRAAVVGGGAAGVEMAFCLQPFLRQSGRTAQICLLDAHPAILSGYRAKTVRIAQRQLQERGIQVLCGRRVTAVRGRELLFVEGESLEADIVLWCVGAAPPPLLSSIDLPKSDAGFLLVDHTLQTTARLPVFAAGDTAEISGAGIPRAGVYAVRQGPVLRDNLNRCLRGDPLRKYRPQRDFLSLLTTGDGQAIGQFYACSGHARWLWQLKRRIDVGFMNRYRPGTGMRSRNGALSADERSSGSGQSFGVNGRFPMRCRGCGGKTSGRVLQNVLQRLRRDADETMHPAFLQSEDAAVLFAGAGPVNVVSVDFFQAFLDDPWLTGRVAAVHALSDLWARGVQPASAMALVTLPAGSHPQQEELLCQLLRGGIRELQAASVVLVGGHTVDGDELSVGFTVLGRTGDGPAPIRKGHLQPEQKLILTHSLGTGVILAARAAGQGTGPWLQSAIQSMLAGNQRTSEIARDFGVRSATDVTGFGLAGHLIEMLGNSDVGAEVRLSQIPLLPGAAECLDQGFRSSLDPENRWVEDRIVVSRANLQQTAAYHALFDPQTSGGLLLAVQSAVESEVLKRLHRSGHPDAVTIGRTVPMRADGVLLQICE